jgi:FkbM family methyltransferase
VREKIALEPILGVIEKPIIFELGAHFGISTGRIKTLAPNSIYYAFEPDIRNLKILWSLYTSNHVNIISKAVGKVDGKVKFWQSGGTNKSGRLHTDSSSIKKPVAHEKMFPWMTFQETEVECVRLDTFCAAKGVTHIDLIWSDVQGAELDVIEGGQETFKRTRWFYTEHMNNPRYEGQPNLGQIIEALPGNWRIDTKWEMDALLENVDYA